MSQRSTDTVQTSFYLEMTGGLVEEHYSQFAAESEWIMNFEIIKK